MVFETLTSQSAVCLVFQKPREDIAKTETKRKHTEAVSL